MGSLPRIRREAELVAVKRYPLDPIGLGQSGLLNQISLDSINGGRLGGRHVRVTGTPATGGITRNWTGPARQRFPKPATLGQRRPDPSTTDRNVGMAYDSNGSGASPAVSAMRRILTPPPGR